MSQAPARPLVGKVAFETAAGGQLGETRIRLLEAIARQGSLSRAAKEVPLSYKAAWDALDAMNRQAERPLVVRTTGGKNGGGTQLTEHGRQIIALYRAMESSQQDILNQLAERPAEGAAAHANASLRSLIRRLSVKTSARNQFMGRVSSLVDGGGLVQVTLALEGGGEMTATITPESVSRMDLVPGSEAYALVKAPWVSVSARVPRRSGLRNVFAGKVAAVTPGQNSTQVALDTDHGHTVVAAMPHDQVAERGLVPGQPAWASFACDSVILATFS